MSEFLSNDLHFIGHFNNYGDNYVYVDGYDVYHNKYDNNRCNLDNDVSIQ